MLRHPAEVVASKERWYDNFSNPTNRLAGWVNTMLYTERATRNTSRSLSSSMRCSRTGLRPSPSLDEQLGLSIMREVRIRHLQAVDQLIDPGSAPIQGDVGGDRGSKTAHRTRRPRLGGHPLAGRGTEPPPDVHDRLDAARQDYVRTYADAEAIAYSSVLAARRAGQRGTTQTVTVPALPPQPVPTTSTSPTTKNLVGRGLRSLPTGVKQLVPESIRGPLRRRLN